MSEYVITCDGGALGNHAGKESAKAYGSFIITPDISPTRFVMNFGFGSNNEAEYQITVSALKYLRMKLHADTSKTFPIETDVVIRTDSALVIGHMTKGWKIKAANLLRHIVALQDEIRFFKSVRFEQISGQEMKKILGH